MIKIEIIPTLIYINTNDLFLYQLRLYAFYILNPNSQNIIIL